MDKNKNRSICTITKPAPYFQSVSKGTPSCKKVTPIHNDEGETHQTPIVDPVITAFVYPNSLAHKKGPSRIYSPTHQVIQAAAEKKKKK